RSGVCLTDEYGPTFDRNRSGTAVAPKHHREKSPACRSGHRCGFLVRPGLGRYEQMRQTSRPLASLWLPVNGLRTHARVPTERVPANRPTVVLVHGLGLSNRYMVPLAQALAPFYRVFAPDLPGFGKSDPPDHVLNVPELADALSAWMDAA